MAGIEKDIELIKKLAKVDRTIEDGAEQFNNSTLQKKINQLRLKKAEVKQKRDQVDSVFVKSREEMQDVAQKDSDLAKAQEKAQQEIAAIQGDYRKVEAHTNKLNALTSQRKELDVKLEKLEANFNKIKSIKEKIDTAIGKLSMQEDDLSAELQETVGQLKLQMDKAQKDKADLESQISPDALKEYRKAKKICGKIVLAELNGNSCSVCRSKISNANMSKIKAEEPISTCPNCFRLLFVS